MSFPDAEHPPTVALLLTQLEKPSYLDQPTSLRLMDRQMAIWRTAISSFRGREVNRIGSGLFASFPTAFDALQAAARAQLESSSSQRECPVLSKSAVHVGRPIPRAMDLVGPSVNRCARVLELGSPGQILLTGPAKRSRFFGLPSGCSARRLGVFRLRGLQQPEELWHLWGAGLPSDFPTITGLRYMPRVPAPLDRLVGRDAKLQEIISIWSSRPHATPAKARTEVVTLLGGGGTGKTRLALEAAPIVSDIFRGRVWFVPLADVRDVAVVPQRIADSLGLQAPADADLSDCLRAVLSRERSLLILDNCEHLVSEPNMHEHFCSTVELLRRPDSALSILATSRVSLGLQGERVVDVHPLEAPPGHRQRERSLAASESERLFALRMCQVRGDRMAGEDGVRETCAIAEICRLVDGLPLALQIVASHTAEMPPAEIASFLGLHLDRLLDVRARERDVVRRQRTLRATLDWSYALLPRTARRALSTLAAFAGGFAVDDALALCGAHESGPLDTLRNHSWTVEVEADRLRLLEPVREYIRRRCPKRSAEADSLHGEHFCDKAEAIQSERERNHVQCAVNQLRADIDNFRAALNWSSRTTDRDMIACRLGRSLGLILIEVGMWQDGSRFAIAGVDAARRLGDYAALATLLHYRANLTGRMGDSVAARAFERESLDAALMSGEEGLCARAWVNLASIAEAEGDCVEAGRLCALAIDAARSAGEHVRLLAAMMVQGRLARRAGDLRRAEAVFLEVRDRFVELDETGGLIMVAVELADIAAKAGNGASRLEHLRGALDAARKAGLAAWISAILRRYGDACSDSGRLRNALFAYTAARRLVEDSATPDQVQAFEARVSSLRELAADGEIDRLVAEATHMGLDDIYRRL